MWRYSSNVTNFKIINKDVLKIDLKEYVNNKTLIFGNLPYNIATKILIDYTDSFMGSDTKALFLFQKEVADKIIAKKQAELDSETSKNILLQRPGLINRLKKDIKFLETGGYWYDFKGNPTNYFDFDTIDDLTEFKSQLTELKTELSNAECGIG